MTLDGYAVFVFTVLVVMLTPGPSTMLAAVQGMRFGARAGVLTALGDISANFLQMLAAVAGLGLLLSQSAGVFMAIKIAGVLYLGYLGLRMLLAKDTPILGADAPERAAPKPARVHVQRGFWVAGTSPKAILFYGALFPQFLNMEAALVPQFLLLSLTCMAIDFTVVVVYATLAARSAAALRGPRAARALNRVGGSMMLGAAGLMATQ